MTNKETKRAINKTAKAYRADHRKYMPKDAVLIDINHGIPYVAIELPNGKEYYFQGEEAGNILEEATTASNKFETSLENTLLWMSNGWG